MTETKGYLTIKEKRFCYMGISCPEKGQYYFNPLEKRFSKGQCAGCRNREIKTIDAYLA